MDGWMDGWVDGWMTLQWGGGEGSRSMSAIETRPGLGLISAQVCLIVCVHTPPISRPLAYFECVLNL